ncbi:MAG TPA: NADH-quinone oxidoreductase subunit L [Chryseolinea sp.]|nr:NADH-quinone oxidoreductase subunit L [Chryseolinea sp.]HPM31158.1 NADH-quinone oxidoreductase subunit L [Chryseolinea sp.]
MEGIQPYQSSTVELLLLIALLLPLLSFIISFSISERYSWMVPFLATLLLLTSVASSVYVFISVWKHEPLVIQLQWFSIADFKFTVGILMNSLSALMLIVVTGISFLVHLYSTGYMVGDASIRRYFAMLGFFTFSMLGIVLADNLLMIFIFWELVGFSSYMLIGHWKEKVEASSAATKAFLINRVGDVGFLIGLMIVWTNQNSFNILELSSSTEIFSWQTAASLCIFCGVMGKSAQFPLLTWLPDAMEGPTPVSALIHAATMVAAGVFLLARIHFVFTLDALDIVIIIGSITTLIGALAALVQHDIKKILAYSTISQLGLMVMAIGAGSPEAAMLHLFTHAFFKAGLFLAAGSIIHSLHEAQHKAHEHFDVQDVRNLGGLRKKLPFTFIAFILCGSALAGLPFFTGFLSKDAILTAIQHWVGGEFSWKWFMLAIAFIVSFITVLYTFRMMWSVFMGEEKRTTTLPVEEPPLVMRIPLAILGFASLWLVVGINPFDYSGWLYSGLHAGKYFQLSLMPLISALWVVLALVAGYLLRKKEIQSSLLFNTFYLDRIYNTLFVKSTLQFAALTNYIDKKWIDGFIHSTVYTQVILAHFTNWFDRIIIDGSVNGVAGLAKGVGSITRSFQNGKIQLYIFWAIFAIIIFLIWLII